MANENEIVELRSKLQAAEEYEDRCLGELQSAEYVLSNAKLLTQIARNKLVTALEAEEGKP